MYHLRRTIAPGGDTVTRTESAGHSGRNPHTPHGTADDDESAPLFGSRQYSTRFGHSQYEHQTYQQATMTPTQSHPYAAAASSSSVPASAAASSSSIPAQSVTSGLSDLAAVSPLLASHGQSDGSSGVGSRPESKFELLSYYVPVLHWLPQYQWSEQFGSDALAGLSVVVLLLPQAIAYAGMANLSASQGLYTAFFPALIYFLLGSSKQMSVGPESTSAILLGHVITKFIAEQDPLLPPTSEAYLELASDTAFRVTFLAGLICLFMGLARTGFVDSILSQPVLEGFICSIALLLITDQIPKLLGLPMGDLSPEAQGFEKLVHSAEHLGDIHGPTAVVSVITLTCLIGMKCLKAAYPRNKALSNFPELFFILLAATGFSSLLDLQSKGVAILGSIEGGFHVPHIPTLNAEHVSSLGSAALSIAILGFVDSGLVSKIYAQKRGYFVSSNRELVALGASNIFGSLFGAFPAYGSLTRTKLADSSGSRSQISNLVTCILIGMVALWLLPVLASMPKASISSMILLVAISLLDLSSLKFLLQLGDRKDALLYLTMCFVTFFFGIDMGLLFAFLTCLLMLVKQVNIPLITLLGKTAQGEFIDVNDPLSQPSKLRDILLLKLAGSLHFANSNALKLGLDRLEMLGHLHAHPASRPQPYFSPASNSSIDIGNGAGEVMEGNRKSIVFDLTDVTTIDSTATHLFIDMLKHYSQRDLTLVILIIRHPPLHERLLVAAGGEKYVSAVFRSIKQGVEFAENYRDHGFKNVSGYESFSRIHTDQAS